MIIIMLVGYLIVGFITLGVIGLLIMNMIQNPLETILFIIAVALCTLVGWAIFTYILP